MPPPIASAVNPPLLLQVPVTLTVLLPLAVTDIPYRGPSTSIITDTVVAVIWIENVSMPLPVSIVQLSVPV